MTPIRRSKEYGKRVIIEGELKVRYKHLRCINGRTGPCPGRRSTVISPVDGMKDKLGPGSEASRFRSQTVQQH
jgi:hypothetical protein